MKTFNKHQSSLQKQGWNKDLLILLYSIIPLKWNSFRIYHSSWTETAPTSTIITWENAAHISGNSKQHLLQQMVGEGLRSYKGDLFWSQKELTPFPLFGFLLIKKLIILAFQKHWPLCFLGTHLDSAFLKRAAWPQSMAGLKTAPQTFQNSSWSDLFS